MILYKTKETGPIVGHDDKYKTSVVARRSVLRITPMWLSWDPEIKYADRDFCQYNAPRGWGIGFMKPFLRPEYMVFPYDGVALCSISIGWFRLNWSRWATKKDWDGRD